MLGSASSRAGRATGPSDLCRRSGIRTDKSVLVTIDGSRLTRGPGGRPSSLGRAFWRRTGARYHTRSNGPDACSYLRRQRYPPSQERGLNRRPFASIIRT